MNHGTCLRALFSLTFLTVLLCGHLSAQKLSAIYQPSDAEVRQVSSVGWEAFQAEFKRQESAGFRIIDLESVRNGPNDRKFLGIFTESVLPSAVEKASGWAAFVKLKRKMAAAEYTMIDVAAVVKNESDFDFYGVWVKEENPTIHKVWFLNSRETMLDRTRKMAKDRFKIKKIHVLPVPNGEPAFVVLYHFSPINRYNFIYFADSAEEFEQERQQRIASKVQLIDYARFREGDKDQYLGIFQDGDYESAFVTPFAIEQIPGKADSLENASGLKLMNLSVY